MAVRIPCPVNLDHSARDLGAPGNRILLFQYGQALRSMFCSWKTRRRGSFVRTGPGTGFGRRKGRSRFLWQSGCSHAEDSPAPRSRVAAGGWGRCSASGVERTRAQPDWFGRTYRASNCCCSLRGPEMVRLVVVLRSDWSRSSTGGVWHLLARRRRSLSDSRAGNLDEKLQRMARCAEAVRARGRGARRSRSASTRPSSRWDARART